MILRKFILFSIIFLSLSCSVFAQLDKSNLWNRSNLGVAIGLMNYSGFMQDKAFTFHNAKPAGELIYRYDITDQFHIRGTLLVGTLKADSINVRGMPRPGYFNTNICEADILPEYDFMNMSTSTWKYKHRWSPYIYVGGGFYRLFNYKASAEADGYKKNLSGFNLRGGLGIKYAISPDIQVFLEGDRREFSKHIDFYDSNSRSRYYSVLVGAVFSLQKRAYRNYW